ncbi:MAG TPA: hypothetical protein VGD76_11080 [Ramlibacter sp.]
MNGKAWGLAAVLLCAGSMAHATCYSVYKADGTLILESSNTPVNLTLPLGDTVPEKFGAGATMTVSDLGVFCKDRRGSAAYKPAAKAPAAQAKASQQDAAAAQAAITAAR